jgi:hypothetical protein
VQPCAPQGVQSRDAGHPKPGSGAEVRFSAQGDLPVDQGKTEKGAEAHGQKVVRARSQREFYIHTSAVTLRPLTKGRITQQPSPERDEGNAFSKNVLASRENKMLATQMKLELIWCNG